MKYLSKYYTLLFYIFLIFGISSFPGDGLIGDINQFGIDKVFHFLEYFVLGIIVCMYIKNKKYIFNIFYILVVFIPIIDEYFIQNMSGRIVDDWDFWANFTGLYSSILIYLLLGKYFDKKTHN
tara:strand:- start:549 stop:917 length:369 start_codon:yes stop_codon:yes gene_type:complete